MAKICKQTPESAIRTVLKADIEALEARVSTLEAKLSEKSAKPNPVKAEKKETKSAPAGKPVAKAKDATKTKAGKAK